MQKDEDDILENWILYHGHLFGFINLYIIDNFSHQSSLDILRKYETKGVRWSQQPDYTKKGDYIFDLIKQHVNECDFAIPLDIDEFVATVDLQNIPENYADTLTQACKSLDCSYYLKRYPQVYTEAKTTEAVQDHFLKKGFRMGWSPCPDEQLKPLPTPDERNRFIQFNRDTILKLYPDVTVSCDRAQILEHFEKLPKYARYSFLYYLTSRNTEVDYQNPIDELITFDLVDYEQSDGKMNHNKKFFDPLKLHSLDHGNHFGRVDGLSQTQYLNTPFILFHYHHRGVRKLIEKCKNDISGLGIVKDLKNVIELRDKVKQQVRGSHNIKTYLTYLTIGPSALCTFDDEGIIIHNMSKALRRPFS